MSETARTNASEQFSFKSGNAGQPSDSGIDRWSGAYGICHPATTADCNESTRAGLCPVTSYKWDRPVLCHYWRSLRRREFKRRILHGRFESSLIVETFLQVLPPAAGRDPDPDQLRLCAGAGGNARVLAEEPACRRREECCPRCRRIATADLAQPGPGPQLRAIVQLGRLLEPEFLYGDPGPVYDSGLR